jgi:hypothetical protein
MNTEARRQFVEDMTVRQLLDTFRYGYTDRDEEISFHAEEVLEWMSNSDVGCVTKLPTLPLTIPAHIAVAALQFAIETGIDNLPDVMETA